jgi:capsid protein
LRSSDNRFGYQIQFIEADLLDENYSIKNEQTGNSIKMGVEVNKFNKPIAYYLLRNHPGGSAGSLYVGNSYVKVPADELIHAYIANRAEQTRGVPWTSSILTRAKMLDGVPGVG